ncbi:unnamed protein product [Gadus morhua 'NCC']
MLYNFIRKPTVAVLYKGETLKRLLDQRWTGHLATVKVVVKSFHDISTLLTEVENTRGLGASRLLRAEDMDLFTVVTLVNSASDCVKTLRTLCTVGSLSSSSHGHRGCAGDRPRSKQEKTHN